MSAPHSVHVADVVAADRPHRAGALRPAAFMTCSRLRRNVDTAEVWFDGACSGNPGPMGAGAVVRFLGQTEILRQHLGRGTNNEAEYGGLLLGLRRAKELGADAVVVRGDSELIIKQLEGTYAVRAANLRPMYEEAKSLLQDFQRVQLKWVRRDRNAAADAAARDAVVAGN